MRACVDGYAYGLRWIAASILALVLLMVGSAAHAHAALLSTEPAQGAVLAQAPDALVLRFTEPVAPLVFKRVLPDGTTTTLDQSVPIDNGLRIPLPPSPAQGNFSISWRVVSADGHPVGGLVAYTVGTGPLPASTNRPDVNAPTWRVVSIYLVRWGLYVALFAAVGAVAFQAFFARGQAPAGGWLRVTLIIALGLMPAALALQGLDALDLPLVGLWREQTWRVAAVSTYGATIALMFVSAVAAWMGRLPGAAVAVLCLAAALACSGHAGAAPPFWLARPAVFVHVFAVIIWIGALVPLLCAVANKKDATALSRFSHAVPWAVGALVISGAVLIWLQITGVASLYRTNYGRILIAKLSLVAVMLAVGAFNRYRLTQGVVSGQADARARMKRLICVEIVLAIAVLALVSGWRFTPPPRALTIASSPVVSVELHSGQASAELTFLLRVDRRFDVTLKITNSPRELAQAKEITLSLSNLTLDIEPLRVALRQSDQCTWVADPFSLPAAGRWSVKADLLVSDFDETELIGEVDLPSR